MSIISGVPQRWSWAAAAGNENMPSNIDVIKHSIQSIAFLLKLIILLANIGLEGDRRDLL
jgi:hypothetical protein